MVADIAQAETQQSKGSPRLIWNDPWSGGRETPALRDNRFKIDRVARTPSHADAGRSIQSPPPPPDYLRYVTIMYVCMYVCVRVGGDLAGRGRLAL